MAEGTAAMTTTAPMAITPKTSARRRTSIPVRAAGSRPTPSDGSTPACSGMVALEGGDRRGEVGLRLGLAREVVPTAGTVAPEGGQELVAPHAGGVFARRPRGPGPRGPGPRGPGPRGPGPRGTRPRGTR